MSHRLTALGSSFAAGPGIKPLADRAAMRSSLNYPHLVAQRLGASLTDLTVSGATTKTILETPQRMLWRRFAPQLQGIPADATLVTVTAGGNDLGYIGGMLKLAYASRLSANPVTGRLGRRVSASGVSPVDAAALERATSGLLAVVDAVRSKAAESRVILVGYLTVLGMDTVTDASSPFSPEERDALREIGRALSGVFAAVGEQSGADVIAVADLSRGHGLGSAEPWVRGFRPLAPASSFHPNARGMSAVADAVLALLAG